MMENRSEDEERSRAIDMLIAGAPKSQIARALGRHRNTIRNWCRDPAFLQELGRRLDERTVEAKLRRAQQITRYADRLQALADKALDAASQGPVDAATRRAIRLWIDLYRKMVVTECEVKSQSLCECLKGERRGPVVASRGRDVVDRAAGGDRAMRSSREADASHCGPRWVKSGVHHAASAA